MIDLEYRWQRNSKGDPTAFGQSPRLEQYLARHPELGSLDRMSLELIGTDTRHAGSGATAPATKNRHRRPRHGTKCKKC